MKRLRQPLFAACLLPLLALSACEDPYKRIQKDSRRFPSLSKERPVGSPCYEGDSAGIKRRFSHPLWPTGGWYGKGSLDFTRQGNASLNHFRSIGGEFAGFIKFDSPGSIRARSYDDIYGDVYCGWSPERFRYTPKDDGVYLSVGRCSVGDGGLSQVTEICWFPNEKKVGKVVFSTAHPSTEIPEVYMVYAPRHIGAFSETRGKKYYYYNQLEGEKVFYSLLQAGRVEETRRLASTTLEHFSYLLGAIDGRTGKPIPPEEFYAEDWKNLLLVNAGLSLFEPESIHSLEKAKRIMEKAGQYCRCDYSKGLIELYMWLARSVQGRHRDVPRPDSQAKRVHGYDPYFVYKLLTNESLDEHSLSRSHFSTGAETTYFWLGARAFLKDQNDSTKKYLEEYLRKPNAGEKYFELAAAAAILGHLKQQRPT